MRRFGSCHRSPTSLPIRCPAFLAGAPAAAAILALGLAGCQTYQAPNARSFDEVVKACEEVLKERYYQYRVYSHPDEGGHLVAYSQAGLDGVSKTRHRVDIYIYWENTGHIMPRVFVRKYYDEAEPPLEKGDFSLAGNGFPDSFEGADHPFAREDWRSIHYDHHLEAEIRDAILARLKVPA
jgi:hypothetical protein